MKHYLPRVACFLMLTSVAFFSAPACGQPVARQPNQTEPAEPHWHLFLDNHAVTRSTGFQRILHRPQPRGVVLKAEKPWETFGVTPYYVGRRQDGSYECYYQTLWHEPGMRVASRIAYAVSDDAIAWKKPVLNLVEGPTQVGNQRRLPLGVSLGSGDANDVYRKTNNLVPCGNPRNLFLHGNVRDPEKRYALGLNYDIPQRIAFCKELPDFINDPQWEEKLVDSGGFIHSHYTTLEYWDDLHQEWVVMRQAPNHPPTRVSGRYASPDMKSWKLDNYLYPDADDSTDPRYFHECYGMMGVHLEGMVFGFAYWFIGDETHPTGNDKGLIGTNTAKGTMEVRIVTSRDGGKTWDRTVSREPWIPHGVLQNSYDRMVRLDCPPLRMGDEDWFYARVGDRDHASYLGYPRDQMVTFQGALYTQKHNRYVSLTAGNRPRILITEPLEVTGETLQLNVDASRGEVKVAVGTDRWMKHKQDAWPFEANLPHWMVEDRWGDTHLEKGFYFDDCDLVQVDSIQCDVRFQEASFKSLLGKTVRLYISVQDADLYGFRFK